MTIIRSPRRERDFTVLSNSVCLDYRLSMKALGLLVRLLARPDNWKTNSDCLSREFGVGRDQVRTVLNELQEFGYMQLNKVQDDAGHWSSTWTVYDEAGNYQPKPENRELGEPSLGNSGPITRTDLTRTDNKLSVVEKTVDQGKFITFWKSYPRKTNKAFAQKKFNQINPDETLFQTIMVSLSTFPFSKEEQYIPHASTWLNGRRWEDEMVVELSPFDRLVRGLK
jgi:hypothetical protein